MEEVWTKVKEMLTGAGGKIVLALVIAVVGMILIKYIMKLVRKAKNFEKLDQTMTRFVLNFIKWLQLEILVIDTLFHNIIRRCCHP